MASEHVERKLAAIVAADVAGYSRLMAADEEGTLARLKAHRKALIDPKIAEHSGRIIKTTGDGMLVEFASVVDAVRCMVEIQRGMLERNADIPADKRIDFRVGVNIGDVIVDGDDIYGDGVNVAARLEGLAEPGGILVSGVVRDQVRDKLSFSFDDLGEREVKNIPRPVRAYRVKLSDDGRPPSPAVKGSGKLGLAGRPISWIGATVLLLVFVAGGAAWYFFGVNRPTPAPRSIVVLPFANLSGDPTQDYLVDALTDELTTSLARVPKSFVIARNTAFTYKGKAVDAKAIGKDLRVRYVLEGSVQPSGAQVRVNAQLIDADSGANLWAEQFDTPRADLLQMQDEIVTHLARALDLQLLDLEAARLKRTPAANPDAQDLALQCAASLQKAGFIGKEADAGFRLCEQALAADPNNVRALSSLSFKYWLPIFFGRSADPKADLDRGDELVSKALALDPNFAAAHLFKANILNLQGRYGEEIAEDERTLALNPSIANAYENEGNAYLALGQFEKALELYDKAIRLSPHDPILNYWYHDKVFAFFGLKQYDQAIEWARRAIAINPNNPVAPGFLIAALALTDHEAEAHEALQSLLALPPNGAARTIAAAKTAFWFTNPHMLDLSDRLIEGLRKAGMPEE